MTEGVKTMKFTCSACGCTVQLNKNLEDGFPIHAYDNILEWSDFGDVVPALEDKIWVRSDTKPLQNEIRIVKVHFPFNFELGEQFWVLFEPALSFFNGWDEHPNEINQSSIVNCRFDSIISTNETSAWIRVKVLDVMLNEFCNKFSSVIYNNKFSWINDKKTDCFIYENWSFYSWSAQGDLGEWALTYKDTCNVEHIILYCEWGFHYDDVYCGNMIFDNENIIRS